MSKKENLYFKAINNGYNTLSYSGVKMYTNCPYKWKKHYIDKVREDSPSIHLVFGSAMHTVIQYWLEQYYSQPNRIVDEIDLKRLLVEEMKNEYKDTMVSLKKKGVSNFNKYKDFTTKQELTEFTLQGVNILDFIKKKKGAYFGKKNFKLKGIEESIYIPSEVNENIMIIGYIDYNIVDTRLEGRKIYKLVDIKTSTKGWNKWKKQDFIEMGQLLFYKYFYAKQNNIDPKDIEIEYFIVKRQIDETSEWPQKRIQLYTPSNGSVSLNKIQKMTNDMVTHCFNPDGTYNSENEYPKTDDNYNCTYCSFKKHCGR